MNTHEHLMHGVSIHHLRFRVRPIETIVLPEQPGTALRGALYQALSENFCSEPYDQISPDHKQRCPVCWLLATEDPLAGRGENIPRPLTVEPPLDRTTYPPSQEMVFGFSLIGQAQNLLPYIARAVQKMGEIGLGKGRGRFRLLSIQEYTPLLDAERTLLDGNTIKIGTLHITPARISEAARDFKSQRVILELLTPLRLTAGQGLVKTITPRVFIQRLIERCQNLAEHYTVPVAQGQRQTWLAEIDQLLEAAARLRTLYDETNWQDSFSGSQRQQRMTPIGGLVGRVAWSGEVNDLQLLLPWLLWGQSLHLGKNAVKGNGLYRVLP